MAGADQGGEGRLGRKGRDDAACGDPFAVGQRHAPGGACLHVDPRHAGVAADRDARRRRRPGHRLGQRGHSAARQAQRALTPPCRPGQADKPGQHRIGRARAQPGPQRGIEGQRALEKRRAQLVIEKVEDIGQEDAAQFAEFCRAHHPGLQPDQRKFHERVPRPRRRARRRHRVERRQHGGKAQKACAQFGPGPDVGRVHGTGQAFAQDPLHPQVVAVGGQRRGGQGRGRPGQAVAGKVHPFGHTRIKVVGQMGQRRRPAARRRPGLEQQHLRPAPRQTVRGGKAVRACADDDGVRRWHRRRSCGRRAGAGRAAPRARHCAPARP